MSTQQDKDAQMAEWQKVRMPGPKHELLKKFVGSWTAEIVMRMGADQPPMQSSGSMKAESMFDGRYIKMEEQGEFMGTPFQDFGLLGYDNYKQKYTIYWAFSMGTQATFVYGMDAKDEKTIVFHGTSDEAMTGRRDVPMRLGYRWQNDNTLIFEIWMEPGLPEEFKSLEITYRRK